MSLAEGVRIQAILHTVFDRGCEMFSTGMLRKTMRLKRILLLLLAASLSACGLADLGQEPTLEPAGEFAIYIPIGDDQIGEPRDLDEMELQESPVLSMDDIISYDGETHVVELESSVGARWDGLELPGKRFVVVVGRELIYTGAFMAAYFSRTYDGVVILWPTMEGSPNTIKIQLGYPWGDFFTGEDPRADPRIMEALRQAGKLR
jgi:hypothetical protein